MVFSLGAREVNFYLCNSEDPGDLIQSPHAQFEMRKQGKHTLMIRAQGAAYLHIVGGTNEVGIHFTNLADA